VTYKQVLTLLSTAGSQLLFALSPASIGLLFLDAATLILSDGLPELDTETVEHPEALLQFERGSVLTKEL
jgi:hypothetical protein